MKAPPKSFVGFILLCIFMIAVIFGYIRCKPRLIESKEAINAYSGDGIAHYISAKLFGKDGVLIDMPEFNMMDGLNTEYDLSGIPAGNPYGIFLIVRLNVEKEKQVIDAILEGKWSYTIKKNGEALKTVTGSLREMDNSGCYIKSKAEDGNEQTVHINEFFKYPIHLKIPDTKDKWSLSVTFTDAALQEPINAHIRLRRGGGP